ncbi:sugar ABC transporter ATP-binding protein [Halalkalibacter sp. AB-rgal2]|uniref:sugar ABC transporter ATP-binding protein n=1 Tax=Halalkalibacter sp. AB-rgal2 TaxID=3242695 RepID=UPI00359E5939
MTKRVIEVENIVKRYPGTTALSGVTMSIHEGEVHTIAGENGAGKSTLMKILAGAISPTEGTVKIGGTVIEEFSPKVSADKGIGIIYQEFNLVPHLTVEENIMLGKENRRGLFVQKQKNVETTKLALKRIGAHFSPKTTVKDLGVAEQQLVEIAKSISQEVNVLIMDEPTAALTEEEVKKLFQLIEQLKNEGVAIIYISHKFDEMFEISDRITVLRDGEYIATKSIDELDHDKLIQLMVGRELEMSTKTSVAQDDIILKVENLSSEDKISNVSFELRRGEVFGVAGLLGSGRTELAKTLFGVFPITGGSFTIDGKKIENVKSPEQAIKLGIGLIPEDRKQEGLVLDQDCVKNIILPSVKKFAKGLFLDGKKEKRVTANYKEKLRIKYYNGQLAGQLSGGNQQKLVIAKTLATNVDLLIFDEPTRGVDIGAKQEIYNLMNQLLSEGKAIIMISSEMPELLNLSDRIAVMCEGEMAGILSQEEATQERILQLAAGLELDNEVKS